MMRQPRGAIPKSILALPGKHVRHERAVMRTGKLLDAYRLGRDDLQVDAEKLP